MKQITGVYTAPRPHWVGDGFPVRSLFSYQSHAQQLSPFLLLDYAGPHTFTPGNEKRGVGEHPHRGFETVTIVYSGEVEHRDSTGRGGVIGPGGELEMVQLWVNLPMKDKMTTPGYQSITHDVIPTVTLPDDAGVVRVIAGRYEETKGPAHTFSPLNVWDMRLQRNRQLTLAQPEGWSTALVVLKGNITVNGTTPVNEAQLVVLSQQGKTLHLEASSDASVLLLSGEPLNEPIVGYGPFVMNTKQEIAEAVRDFNSGRFGQI
ncbi:pirin family protein [Salmonella enterica]|nr:pirin family protein [Salmonella enterica]EKK3832470.1 pirin family protein [Salmonella enterica]